MPRKSKQKKQVPSTDYTIFYDKIFPILKALIRIGYFSFEVEGVENIPPKGRIIYAGNHSGWFTIDSFFFALAVFEGVGPQRFPYTIVHDMLIKFPGLKHVFKDLGVIPASWTRNIEDIPREIEAIGIYPEGANGNCKPFWKAYQLSQWKKGFIRMAILRRAKIIPTVFIGGEECLPVAGGVSLLKKYIGSIMPLPLVAFPLPTKWKIMFLKPIDLSSYPLSAASDPVLCAKLAAKVRKRVQKTLDKETADRPIAKITSFADKIASFDIRKVLPHR